MGKQQTQTKTVNCEFKRVLRVLLCAVLVVALSVSLFACNDEDEQKKKAAKERADAVSGFSNAVLSAMDERWNGDMSTEELMQIDNSGDYIVAYSWLDFLGGIISESDLPTAKINKLNGEISSKSGQALFSDFGENAANLIPILKQTGFTSSDLNGLVFSSFKKLALQSGTVFDESMSRLSQLKSAAVSPDVLTSVNAAIIRMNTAKSAYSAFTANKDGQSKADKFVDALENAKSGINALITFAYNLSISTLTDNIFNSLSTGALTDITNQEALTYIKSASSGFKTLKTALTEEQVGYLNQVFKTLTDDFSEMTSTSAIFGVLVSYASTADIAVSFLPELCDYATRAFDVVDEAFVQRLRDYLLLSQQDSQNGASDGANDSQNENNEVLSEANKGIFYAALLNSAFKGVSAEKILNSVEAIANGADGNLKKAIIPFYIDIVLNTLLYETDETGSGDYKAVYLTDEVYGVVTTSAIASEKLVEFKSAYYFYMGGNGTKNELDSLASLLKNYYDPKGHMPSDSYSEAWFNEIVYKTEAALERNISALTQTVLDDVKNLADDLLGGEINLDKLAQMNFITDDDESDSAKALKMFYSKITLVLSLGSLA